MKEQKEIMNLKKKSLANRKPQVAPRLIHTIMLCKFLPIQFITWLTRIPCIQDLRLYSSNSHHLHCRENIFCIETSEIAIAINNGSRAVRATSDDGD